MKLTKLLSAHFLVALFLLLLNDFYLKSALHNGFTGKLSDFAGLFVFAFFWSVIFSGKSKWVHVFTVLFFVWFKSPFSQLALDFINSLGVMHVARVIDYWDLMALSILPVSYLLSKRELPTLNTSWLRVPIAGLAFFAFCSTSQVFVHDTVKAPLDEQQFSRKMDKQNIRHQFFDVPDTVRYENRVHQWYSVRVIDTANYVMQSSIDSIVSGRIRKLQVEFDHKGTNYSTILEKMTYNSDKHSFWDLSSETLVKVINEEGTKELTIQELIDDPYSDLDKIKYFIKMSGLKYTKQKTSRYGYERRFTPESIEVRKSKRTFQDSALMYRVIEWYEGNDVDVEKLKSDLKQYLQ